MLIFSEIVCIVQMVNANNPSQKRIQFNTFDKAG